jgi:hypothetical protein
MNKQPTVETKLADWTSAFYSMSNKESSEAQILKELVNNLRKKIHEGMVIIPGRI